MNKRRMIRSGWALLLVLALTVLPAAAEGTRQLDPNYTDLPDSYTGAPTNASGAFSTADKRAAG